MSYYLESLGTVRLFNFLIPKIITGIIWVTAFFFLMYFIAKIMWWVGKTRRTFKRNAKTGWAKGWFGNYWYEAKIYNEPLSIGINNSRISKLLVKTKMKDFWIIHYDNGWSIRPSTEEEEVLVENLVKFLKSKVS